MNEWKKRCEEKKKVNRKLISYLYPNQYKWFITTEKIGRHPNINNSNNKNHHHPNESLQLLGDINGIGYIHRGKSVDRVPQFGDWMLYSFNIGISPIGFRFWKLFTICSAGADELSAPISGQLLFMVVCASSKVREMMMICGDWGRSGG